LRQRRRWWWGWEWKREWGKITVWREGKKIIVGRVG
jgi:hypothetical protein